MSNRSIELSPALYEYLLTHSLREPDVLRRLRAETATLEMARMQIAPEQGQFMALLLKLINARTYLEIGTFTGYSALACALAMPDDAHVYALDISAEWTAIAQRYWQEAGVADRIELILADAQTTLAKLRETHSNTIDMIFIDADKTGYAAYVESAYQLLREGGLLALDNTLWGGDVLNSDTTDPDTRALQKLNAELHQDERFDISLVPIGDGLTLARKRA